MRPTYEQWKKELREIAEEYNSEWVVDAQEDWYWQEIYDRGFHSPDSAFHAEFGRNY